MANTFKKDFSEFVGLKKTYITCISYRPFLSGGRNVTFLVCECVCGKEIHVAPSKFHENQNYSCGCVHKTKKSGELSRKHQLYLTWMGMRQRCLNVNSSSYARYGGRGIKICKRWDDFYLFCKDMGDKPTPQHSIDRIDNNGNYKPENCKWSTRSEQQRNKGR